MADLESPDDSTRGEGNFDACPQPCGTAGCKKSCCKDNTPQHQVYGIHACADHK